MNLDGFIINLDRVLVLAVLVLVIIWLIIYIKKNSSVRVSQQFNKNYAEV